MIYWIISLNVRGRGAICINLGMICYDGAAAAHCKGENIAKSISEISPRFLLLCSKVYQMIQILFCGFLSQLVFGQTKSAWGGGRVSNGCTLLLYIFIHTISNKHLDFFFAQLLKHCIAINDKTRMMLSYILRYFPCTNALRPVCLKHVEKFDTDN